MKRLLLIAPLVLVVLGVLLYTLAGTQPGLRWLAARIAARLPEGSRYDEIRGNLFGPIEVANLRLVIGGYVVEIGNAHIEWAPTELLHHSVHVGRVEASDVRLQLAPSVGAKASAKPLPVAVQVDALVIERFDILPTPDRAPIHLDAVELAGRLDANGVELHSLRAQGMGAHAQGELAFGKATPLRARITWDYTVSGLPAFAGKLDAHGDGGAIRIEQNLESPYNARFEGTLDPDARRVQGRLVTEALTLDALRSDWPALAISATADLDGTLDGVNGVLSGTLTPSGGAPIEVSGTANATREQLVLTQARLHTSVLTLEGQAETSLRSLFSGTPLAELPVTLDLSALDIAVPEVGHLRGEAHLSGSYSQHELHAQGQLETPLAVTGNWKLAARGAERMVTIDDLSADLANGSANARGNFEWGASQKMELQVSLRRADPGVLWRDASGRLDADAKIAFDTAQRRFALDLASLSGTLRGQPVTGQGAVRYDGGTWRIDAFTLAAGDTRFSASGEIAQRATVRWNLEAPELGRAIPGWAGSLRGSGGVTGSAATPLFQGQLEGTSLALFGITATTLQAEWSVDLSGGSASHVQLAADALVAAGRHFDSVRVEGSGPIGQHTVQIEAQSGETHVTVGFAGGWKPGVWRGQVEALSLQPPESSEWTLAQPAAISLTAARLESEPICLHDGGAISCLRVDWHAPHTWSASATLQDMPLAAFAPLLPEALGYRGHIAGNFDLSGEGTHLTRVEGAVSLDAGMLTRDNPPLRLLGWEQVQLQVQLAKDRVNLSSSVQLAENRGSMTLELVLLSADLAHIAREPIEGRLEGQLVNVPLVSALSPDLSELRGETGLDLRISGTLAEPEIYGDASIRNGAADVPRLGISLHDVRFEMHGDGRTMSLDGEAQSGGGRITFSGTLAPAADGWQGNASISGQDFRLIELPEATGDISPDVRVALKGRDLHVEGDVSIPRAKIAPRDFAGAVRVSPDAVVVGPHAEPENQSPWLLDAQLRLILGADVTFDGFGLDADIGGSVLLADHPGVPTTGTGELRVNEGTYTAYGRELTIDHGRLLFNGGLIDNPALDARASRHLEEQSVGVDVRGTLRKPELRLYSDPPLSQSDALAYLLIGRSVGTLSGGEQAELADTTRQIGLQGAGFLAAQVGRRIGTEVGIEEVGVGEENREERTALFIGKYLSPKLYIGYGVGLFETVNTWRVRYYLTPRLLLQAESGTEHSADAIYSIDR